MSTDELVSRDLATTAAANRAGRQTLSETIGAVRAAHTHAAPAVSTGPVRWLVLGEIYASRTARAAAGAAALASLVLVFAFNAAKKLHLLHYNSAWFSGEPLAVAIVLLVGILLLRIAVRGWAGRSFASAVAVPGRAERMLADSDRRALLFGIAGPFVFALVFGVSYFVLRNESLDTFACALDASCWSGGSDVDAYTARVRDFAILVPLGIAGALAIARRPSLPRLGRFPVVIACLLLLLGTVLVGVRFDEGPWPLNPADNDYVPSPVLSQILTITGAVGLFGTLASLALWRRTEENARIATTSS